MAGVTGAFLSLADCGVLDLLVAAVVGVTGAAFLLPTEGLDLPFLDIAPALIALDSHLLSKSSRCESVML